MEISHDVAAVLAEYPRQLRPLCVEALASAGGFSGAALWRVAAPGGLFCLRRWPLEHPSPDRLTCIHAVLRHVGGCGLAIVPEPRLTSQGRTFVQCNGRLWGSRRRGCPGRRTIARIHGPSGWPRPCRPWPDSMSRRPAFRAGPCPAALARPSRAAGIFRPPAAAGIRRHPPGGGPAAASPLVELARRLIDLFPKLATPIQSEMEAAVRSPLPLVPCLRDIWHDHVLFTGERVTGLVDFGALRPESVAGDVALLVGSLAGDDAAGWIRRNPGLPAGSSAGARGNRRSCSPPLTTARSCYPA